ncbi:hypothetical protein PG996_003299 [Apiospora saccharicola]|uniref:Secreted protein n=1 Tax=Apiospora saccharicola TaxID=335842 RepID=A0ABR1W0V9_9PEZI
MSRSQSTALVFVAVALLFLFWKNSAADSFPLTGSRPDSAATTSMASSNLEVSIRQAGEHKLALAVTNTGDKPLNVLTWNSPLDPIALKLGLVELFPSGSSEPIQINTIQVRRKMPPESDSLVTIKAGETKENVLEIGEPVVPSDKLQGAMTVRCKGTWMGVWSADEFKTEELEKIGSADETQFGDFEAELKSVEL